MLEDWARIKSVLEEALAREGRDRSAFLAEACGSDAVLRQRVDALLASHGATETFLETPAISILDLSRRGEDLSGRTVGAYRLVARIGAGAMGDVYEAHDQKLDRRVAIKLIAKHLAGDSNRLRRFSHEARAASSLNHPNIVVVHDFGELDDRPFIVTEFVEGETLRARIKRGPVAVSDAVAIALQVAGALAAAHARELVHRDIKPENVMVRPDGYIKIVDFGLAKLARVERVAGAATFDTQPGQMAGTPCYMSPEQARGLDVDASTDTWSLGALLYEMIAGRPPFQGLTTADVLAAVLTAEPLPLEAIAGHTPAVVSQLVEKALRKERSERYPHASAIAAELAAIKKQLDTATTVPPMRASGPDADEIVLQAAGERRRGTVLVSLVSGYASLVERLAPAHVDRIVAQLRAASADTVRRHGGIVNQTIGEQIVSLFGIPTAHEDDDLRAVRAALELHARAREIGDAVASSTGIHVRIQSGLHAGSVVVQKVRDGTRRYGVTGAPIEIASRLSSAAEPDSILVSAELQRVVAPFVRTEPHALVRVRADEDVATHTLTGESGVDSRLAAAERVGLTPYTGRANELTTLEGEVDHGRRGEGRLVLVVGEAGSGKSRLLHELRSRVAGTNLRIFQGRCRSYGASAYLPFVQALRALIGLGEYESGERPVSDIAARIRAVEPSLEPFIPLYLHLLSRESDEFVVPRHLRGEHFAAAMHDALAAIFTSYAQQTPVLLLLEDWHWADDASRDALRQLGEVVGGYPLAIVVTSRPEAGVLETVPEPRTRINLIPLNAPASLAIVKALLGTERIPEELGRRLHDRTSGNPFFLEEMCHALREAGVVAARGAELVILDPAEGLDLPDSVQAVIRSRIDRLNPDAREALRVAAVIGREFTRSLLSDVLGIDPADPIERLKSAGLVQQTRIVPDARYRFKHVLTQEVAYDSLLEHQRKTLQLAVGRALERAHRDDADRPLELLAYHFSRGEAWPEAIAYGERAADRANALSEFADALTLLERVQSWLMRLDDTSDRRDRLADVLLKQERACETLGLRSRQQQLSAELVALLAPHGASARLAEAYLRQGDVSTLLKRFDVADRALATALRMSREHADAALERRTLRSIGLLRWHEGRHTEALAITERALAIDRERGDELAVAGDLSNIVPILRSLGQHERALACLEEALAIPALADDPIRLQYLLHNTANVHRSLGNLTAALAYLERADEGARLHMLPIQRSFHLTAIAHIRLQQGRLEESLRLYQEAVELSRRSRHADGLAQSLRMLGELLYSIGREEESLPHLQEAAHLFAQLEDRGAEASMWRYVALVRERSGRDDVSAAWQHARERAQAAGDATAELDAAEGIARATRRVAASEAIGRYEEALALAARAGDRLREAALVNTLGILEFERREYAAALRHYESGLAMARTRNDRGHEGLTLNSIGVTLARLQRYEEARTALEEALAVNRESGQRLLQSHTLAALGDIAQTLGRFDTAVEYFESALAIRRELDDRVGQGWMLHRLSRTRALMGDRDAAAELGRAAAQIAAQCGDAALGRACGVTGEDAKAAVQS
jgi:serine/threonine protein kinase/tetratricopeptide (TPR) repeat protein